MIWFEFEVDFLALIRIDQILNNGGSVKYLISPPPGSIAPLLQVATHRHVYDDFYWPILYPSY